MEDLVLGWGRYWLELSNIRVDSALELQQKNSEGEWIKREPDSGDYIFADSSDDIAEINERFESTEALRRISAQRVIRATVNNPNWSRKIFKGIPEDKNPYSTDDLLEITPNLVEIYEGVGPDGSAQVAPWGFHSDDDGSAFFAFSLNPEGFDNALQLLLQPNTTFHMECSVKGWIGFLEGGGQVVCLDPQEVRSRAELFNLGANRVVPNSADTHEDQDLESHQEMSELQEWVVQSITKIEQRLENLEKHLNSIQITNWITAIAIVFVAITLLI
jgi:hypothetical protein